MISFLTRKLACRHEGYGASLTNLASFKPSNYDLTIDGITFSPVWTYEGLVTISGSVKAGSEIVLNAHQLKLHEAQLETPEGIKSAKIQREEREQRVKLIFEEDFPKSQHAKLTIRFQGVINDVSLTSKKHATTQLD